MDGTNPLPNPPPMGEGTEPFTEEWGTEPSPIGEGQGGGSTWIHNKVDKTTAAFAAVCVKLLYQATFINAVRLRLR
jgi:hypothetical protein